MNYVEINIDTWTLLNPPDFESGGYPSKAIRIKEDEPALLHLFKDKSNHYHFAIEASNLQTIDIMDPGVNGLKVQLVDYRFHNGPITRFIDLTCSIASYLEEFTEIVREISKSILTDKEESISAVNRIINNWISFWGHVNKKTLSEEDQIGLICELILLAKLCEINPSKALKTWTGPLGEKHDFNFTDWNFEVKGTRKTNRIHTINGIDQLKPLLNKNLAFISFLLTTSTSEHSINLPCIIELIINNYFNSTPDLVVKFNELLVKLGYNLVHADQYKEFNVEIIDSTFFEINNDFPKLTSGMLNTALNIRISSVSYDISLEGMAGLSFNLINWRNYFY